jgi:hypothetical protein
VAENQLTKSILIFLKTWEVKLEKSIAKFLRLNSRSADRAMIQEVIRLPLNADTRFRSQANLYGICSEKLLNECFCLHLPTVLQQCFTLIFNLSTTDLT